MKERKTKAWCIVNKKTNKITTTEYGAGRNLALNVYPMNKKGEYNALSSFNGYQEVVECEIKIIDRHKCDCKYCKRKNFSVSECND